MDAQTELTLLETAYSNYVSNGVASYTINGRTVQKVDIKWLTQRMDQLRAQVYRANSGMFGVGQFRRPE